MAETGRVAVLDGSGEILVEERTVPEPDAGEVLVDVEASLLSPGTETSMIASRRETPEERAPFPIGYQSAGVVAATGDGVTDLAPGDRVACMGSGYAPHADYGAVPRNLCVELPDGVSFEEGAFCHLGATALHALRRGDVEFGEHVAVLGLGIVGQLTARLAQLAGCHVLGTDLLDPRVELADRFGIDRVVGADADLRDVAAAFTRSYGVDCGFVCFGADATEAFGALHDAMVESADGHAMGRVVVVGGTRMDLQYSASMGNVDVRNAVRTGPGYHDPDYERGERYPAGFVTWDTQRNLQEVLRRVDAGDLRVEALVTDRYALDDVADAYDRILDRPGESVGVVVEP